MRQAAGNMSAGTAGAGWVGRTGLMRYTGYIRGVCAQLAERAGVPVWMPRMAFLIFGVLHWVLALVLYFVLAKVLCARRDRAGTIESAMAAGPPATAVRDRFSALDARLADLESATLQQETNLRRAFRDLEHT